MSSVEKNSNSVIAKELICEACNSELVTGFISASQSSKTVIRCGNCGELWSPFQADGAVDKNAWRSLWLGLASILLLCFTGIPAMYLGIKSLLRTRYTRIRPQDHRAAITGTVLGGLFGVFGSFCVFGVGGVALIMMSSFVNTSNVEQTRHVLDGLVEIDFPEELVEGRAGKMLGSTTFRFEDQEKRELTDVRFDLVYFPPAMIGSVATLGQQLKGRRLDSKATYTEQQDDKLKWTLCGRPLDVTNVIFEETREDQSVNEIHHYSGFVSVKEGIFGFAFICRQPHEVFSQLRVREIIESIVPKQNMDIDERWKQISKMKTEEGNQDTENLPSPNSDDSQEKPEQEE